MKEPPRPGSGPPRRTAVIRELRDEAPGVRTFRLALEPAAELDFLPGQFMRIRFPGEEDWRDYSLSSAPPIRGVFEITLNRAGRFTDRLFQLAPGDALTAEGPMGDWHYRDDGRPIVLAAGGTGITPFRSMLAYLLGRGLPQPVWLFYSARTPEHRVFRRDLEAYPSRGIQVVTTITRPQDMAQNERWAGPVGRITAAMIVRSVPSFDSCVFYLCGPASFVNGLRESLAERGVPAERLLFESWG